MSRPCQGLRRRSILLPLLFLAPIFAGYLLESGFALPTVGMVMALGSFCGAIVLMFVRLDSERATDRVQSVPTLTRARVNCP